MSRHDDDEVEVELPFDPAKAADPEFQLPDIVGTVEGWRAYGVPTTLPKFGVPPKLYSPSHDTSYYWIPRKVSVAICDRTKVQNPEGCPDMEDHACGFYSAKSLEHLMTMSYHQYDAERNSMFHVIGRVANWGKVIEGSLGWRAQKSYPVELFVPFEAWGLAKALGESYGVPVRLKNILNIQPEPVDE